MAAIADRAAEDAVRRWQQHPAGAALLSELAAAAEAGRSAASDYLALALADLGMADNAANEGSSVAVDAAALARSSPAWPRPPARRCAAGRTTCWIWCRRRTLPSARSPGWSPSTPSPLALVLMIGVLAARVGQAPRRPAGRRQAGPGAAAEGGTGPERLLGSLFGAGQLRDLTARARQDLQSGWRPCSMASRSASARSLTPPEPPMRPSPPSWWRPARPLRPQGERHGQAARERPADWLAR